MANVITVGMEIKVSNTFCIGLKIEDRSYVATVKKVNSKSFVTVEGGKFTLRKTFEDGEKLFKNDMGHIVVIK